MIVGWKDRRGDKGVLVPPAEPTPKRISVRKVISQVLLRGDATGAEPAPGTTGFQDAQERSEMLRRAQRIGLHGLRKKELATYDPSLIEFISGGPVSPILLLQDHLR